MRVFSSLITALCLAFSAHAFAGGVPEKAEDTNPIKVGQTLPEITLKDINGKDVALKKLAAQQKTLLVFYRGGWCPYCNRHLSDLRKVESDLKTLGYQIVAISPDLPENLKESLDKNKLEYQLLSDSKADAAKALGIAFKVDAETNKKYLGYGIDLEKASGEKHRILPIPAAILLDTTGKVDFIFSSPDYTVRVDQDVLLAAAKSAAKQ